MEVHASFLVHMVCVAANRKMPDAYAKFWVKKTVAAFLTKNGLYRKLT